MIHEFGLSLQFSIVGISLELGLFQFLQKFTFFGWLYPTGAPKWKDHEEIEGKGSNSWVWSKVEWNDEIIFQKAGL